MSYDQAIVDAMVTMLERIRVDNGFGSEAGEHVLDEQVRQDVPPEAYTLAVIDETETLRPDGQSYLRRGGVLEVRIEGAVPISNASEAGADFQPVRRQARQLMADIRRAIASRKLTDFPIGTTGVRITGRSLPQLEDGSSYQFCSVTFAFDFTELHTPKE